MLPLMALLLFSSCLKTENLKIARNSQPQQLSDGWAVGTPSSVGLDQSKIDQVLNILFDEDQFVASRSLLIVRNNRLVLESYSRELSDRERLSDIRGITKGISSLLLGFVMDEGLIEDVTDSLYTYIPQYFDSVQMRRQISLFDVLTMRTGMKWSDRENSIELFDTQRFPSSMRVVMQKPMVFEPGTRFNDNEGTPQILSGLIRETTGLSLEEYANEKLFSFIGISNYIWEKHPDGMNYAATSLFMTPRDLAKIGQFVMQYGQWEGTQLVSSSWVYASTIAQLSPAETLSAPYGFYWWIRPDKNAFCALGQGGQFLYVVPSKNLVIVHTANPYPGYDYRGVTLQEFELLVSLILQAAD